ncbi:UNVERIFIED_ORG: alpha-tubulin suppressor-like RCC1 family protein, partial [Arthrobacter sp. UYEF10]
QPSQTTKPATTNPWPRNRNQLRNCLKNLTCAHAWGGNNSGQVGDGTTTKRSLPRRVPTLSGITSIAAGSSNGYALKNDGTVWAWGNNNYGQLGDGTTISQLSPVQVPGLTGINEIYTGSESSFALASDGTVWGWGYNSMGQLGDGTTTHRLAPVKLPITNVKMIAVGDYQSTYALKNDGTVWSWGLNYAGQLGYGSTGPATSSPAQVQGLPAVSFIDAGSSSAFALATDTTVWAWGENSSGRLGDGTTENRPLPVQLQPLTGVTKITAGSYGNVFAMRSDRSVWGWGSNAYGQMFDPFTSPGPNYPPYGGIRPIPADIPQLLGVSAIEAGGFGSSYVVKSDGSAWAWGHNYAGQLGDGTTTTRLELIPVGTAGT